MALLLALLLPGIARAVDERVTYLIETLEESINYRVRVQTLESLNQVAVTAGAEDLTAIVNAVKGALEDSNALVRYAAASTLVGLGRSSLRSTDLPGVISALEPLASDADADVKQIVSGSLESLRSRLQQLQGGGSSSSGASTGGAPAPIRFYVAVAELGDSSGAGRDDLPELAHEFFLDELKNVGGVEPHGEVPAGEAFNRELQRRNLKGFVLQGSVVELRRESSQVSAVVSVLVLDQDQNLRVMLRGTGNAVRRTGAVTDADLPSLQGDALRAAVGAAVNSLAGYLRDQ